MIKLHSKVLPEPGFLEEDVFGSLVYRMKCGICPSGVCLDGPVFTCAEPDAHPAE
jgi:hypothetical protein